ncbi:hypothetical protein TNCV_4635761 [Trichonephila clavipes]|nr:hypothetical protein TNCV_4635761 [Trichonephila clavipes]
MEEENISAPTTYGETGYGQISVVRPAVGSLVVRALDSRPEGLGSMLDVTHTEYVLVKSRSLVGLFTSAGTGNISLPFSSLAEIVEVEIEVVLPSIVPSGKSLNRTVTCMVLKANDRRTSCPCHDEFRGPRSDYVRQVVELDRHSTGSPKNGGHAEETKNAITQLCHVKNYRVSIPTGYHPTS